MDAIALLIEPDFELLEKNLFNRGWQLIEYAELRKVLAQKVQLVGCSLLSRLLTDLWQLENFLLVVAVHKLHEVVARLQPAWKQPQLFLSELDAYIIPGLPLAYWNR